MKTQPWPVEKLNEVRNQLVAHNYVCGRRSFWYPDGDILSSYWFYVEPLYDNIMLTLYYDGERMEVQKVLDNPDKYPERMLETCIFFLDVLR